MAANSFDMIVIGAGPGGYVAAIRGAQLGLNVAIVEREHLGGICLNWGCIPTKALLRSAEVFHLMHRAKEFGLKADGIGYDLGAVVQRSRGVAKQLSGGIGHLMKKNKITVFMGAATIPAKGKVSVKTEKGTEELTAKSIVLATGARARELPGLEADGDLVWTYRHALQPKRMPKKLLVIGSGAIGIEFASFFNTLGADTTVVEVMDRVLPVEDAEISAFAKKQFVKQGMKIMEKSTVKKLDRAKGKVTAHIEAGGKTETMEFDTVISAVGIVGNVEDLGLEALGVKIDRTHVVTDEYCRTGVEGLYAIGDIAGAPWLAHKASHEGVMVAELIAGQHPHPIKPNSIVSVLPPASIWAVTLPPPFPSGARSSFLTVDFSMIFMPCLTNCFFAKAEISASSTGSTRSMTSTTVVSAPSVLKKLANSMPMAPDPMTRSFFGIRLACSACL